MTDVFTLAVDALFADPNIGEDALWKPSGTGPGVPVRVIRKSPDSEAAFGQSRALLPSVVVDIRRSEAAAIAEGDLFVIGAESYKIIGEPMGDAQGLVVACEVGKA